MDARANTPKRTTCPYCGVGCGLKASVGDLGIDIVGDRDHPANFGRLCSKGAALAETIAVEERLLYPEVAGRRVSWDTALDHVATQFSRTIAEHGADSVAFYVSGQLLTEDYYVANKLMKGFIGSANIDTNSRLCMASSVAGHRRAFGSDTVPGVYDDLEQADLVVLVGSNLAWCHPVLYQRIAAAKQRRSSMRVVVIDPRRTATTEIADLHLSLRPDTDVIVFNGLLRCLGESGSIDADYVKAHTLGLAAALESANKATVTTVAEQTGVRAEDINRFFDWVVETERTVTIYSQGVNQSESGTDKVNAIINTHLLTGRIGKPGMGPFSVTGQPNAMGGREVGGLANMLACHMNLESPEHRSLVRGFWNSPTIADKPGLKAVELFDAVHDGRIKAMWVMATNPADSMPDACRVEAALRKVPLLVVSDVVAETDTLRHAHVKLPAAAWGEKDGTVTNSERRISRQRAFLSMPGEAQPDWRVIADVGTRMGWASAFAYDGPHAIFDEYARLSGEENGGARDFDISGMAGLDRAAYDRMAPFQWPRRSGMNSSETRFFANGGFYHPDRRARFVAVTQEPIAENPPRYPFILNTGRIRDQWHTMTRTGRSPTLSAHIAEPFVEIHPEDADRCGIRPAELARISSPRGSVIVRALITERQQRDSVFAPMHWTDQTSSNARIDRLVAPQTDPHSGQPASKSSNVALERWPAAWYGFAVLREIPDLGRFGYWAVARTAGGISVEIADAVSDLDPHAVATKLLGAEDVLSYVDAGTGAAGFAALESDRLAGAVFFGAEPVPVSRRWAADLLGRYFDDRADCIAILAGRPSGNRPDPGPTICACMTVGANQIALAAVDGARTVEAVGDCTGAGTGCGSCRAEIANIIDRHSNEAPHDRALRATAIAV